MEPRSVTENGLESNSSLRLFLPGSQSQGLQNVEGMGMDEFWDGQWPSLSKDWADFNSKSQVMDQNLVQGCDSPLASDSSSSLSTRDSSFFSWSEGSYSAAKHVLHSPELLSSRFMGFSLFNSGVMEPVFREAFQSEKLASRDKVQDGYTLHQADILHRLVEPEQSNCRDSNTHNLRPPGFEYGRDHFTKEDESYAVKDLLDGDWVSDSSDSGASTTSLSQDLQRGPSCDEADDVHCTRFLREWQRPIDARLSHFQVHENFVEADAACINQADRLDLTMQQPEKDSGTNGSLNIAESCSYTCTYKGKTAFNGGAVLSNSRLLENNDVYSACSVKDFTHCSVLQPKKSYAAPHKHSISRLFPDQWNKGYIKGLCDSVRADNVGMLSHVLDNKRHNVDPTSVQLGDAKELFSHRKACLSAGIKERFASSILRGYLRCAEQGDSPCYSFFLDDSDEVLFARASRQERKSNKENSEWTYSFHSKKDIVKAKGAWKACPKKENLASNLVANLRVSSGVCPRKAKSNQDGRAKEARFVLYASGGHDQVESQGAGSTSKMRGQPLKPVFENASSLQAGKIKEGIECIIPGASVVKRTVCHPISTINRSTRLEAGKEDVAPTFSSEGKLKPNHSRQMELAAIIIGVSAKEKKISKRKESPATVKDGAGWGMKFLDKGTGGWGMNYMEKTLNNSRGLEEMAACKSSGRCESTSFCKGDLSRQAVCESHLVRPHDDQDIIPDDGPDPAQKFRKKTNLKRNRLKVDVTVILPAGDHGLPDEDEEDDNGVPGSHGPTPLLERWMSGGDCDCGGWDMGCGLSVFKAETLTLGRKTTNIALTRNDRMNWISAGSPFKLLTQGYKHKKVLVLEIIEAGLFSMSFQARLSPLQAFAIAVALFHQQITHK